MRNNSYPDDNVTQVLKVPPQAIEAEQSVLGGMMSDSEVIDDILNILQEDHFYTNAHRLIYRAMMALIQNNEVPDIITVRSRLEKDKSLDTIGGLSYLDQLIRNTPGTSNIITYAKYIVDKATERKMILSANKIIEMVYDADKATSEMVDSFELEASKLNDSSFSGGPVKVGDSMPDVIDEIERRSLCDGLVGLTTGLTDLDAITSGFEKTDLIVLGGKPSTGKTSFAMNIAEKVALTDKGNVAVFSLESPKQQIIMRSLSSTTGVPFTFLRNGTLNEAQTRTITAGAKILSNSNLYIDDEGGLSAMQIKSRARKLHRKMPLDLIVIDYFQLIEWQGENQTEGETANSKAIKNLCKELNIPIILLSQLKKVNYDKRPTQGDLRGSGGLIQEADTIIFLYREGEKTTVEAIVDKQRNGPRGTAYLYFPGETLKFKNGAKPEPEPEQTKKQRGFDYEK